MSEVISAARRPMFFRKLLNSVMWLLSVAGVALAVFCMLWILWSVIKNGAGVISLDFIFCGSKPAGEPDNGVGNAILGTIFITLMAVLIGVPAAFAGGIGLAQFHMDALHTGHPSLIIGKNLSRIGQQIKDDAFLFCMMYFFHSGRKFFFTSSIYNMNLCAKSQCCSCSIHCNVTTTNDSYLLATHNRCIGIFIECFHQVASCQVLIC